MVKKRKDEKSTRWASGREEISKEADPNRMYLCCIPTPDGQAYLGVNVFPDKKYGEETGREIIAKYLSRNWRTEKIAKTGNLRQTEYINKPRFADGRSIADWNRVNELGNPMDDGEFRKHKRKVENLQEKEAYLRKLNEMKQKLNYDVGNQAFMPSEKPPRKRGEVTDDETDPYAIPEETDEDLDAQQE